MYAEVQSVEVLSLGMLAVVFRVGVGGVVEIAPSFYRGVFSHLQKMEEFTQVHVENGYITWPGELDLAPDAMYNAIAKTGLFSIY